MAHNEASSALKNGIRSMRPMLVTAFVFSFFINVLLFVGPLYMLQIYDRVLASRNEATLLGITLIAAFSASSAASATRTSASESSLRRSASHDGDAACCT